MNNLIKAVLFSISTALIATPAMAATQHKVPAHSTVKHHVATVKQDQHKHHVKHTTQKVVKKHHTPVKKAPVHHMVKHDVKHR